MGEAVAMTMPAGRGHERLLPLRPMLVRPRCLFGRPDPLYLKDALSQISQENKLRWNFDFEMERPLSGRYKWEAVEPAKKSGSVSVADDETREKSGSAGARAESDPGGCCSEEKSPAKEEVAEPRCRQTQITDFMRKRKSSNHKTASFAPPPKIQRRAST